MTSTTMISTVTQWTLRL